MTSRGVPAWVWIVALVPLAVVALGVASGLSLYGLRKHLANAEAARSAASAAPAPPPTSTRPPLSGEPADLSSIMGRARRLADEWQREAALLGVEARLLRGKVQTSEGASAKLTFGPSPFAGERQRSGSFVVTYDRSGLRGAPEPGRGGKPLPEPRCAPEHVLPLVSDWSAEAITLRYGFDRDERALWFASPAERPAELRVFDPGDCRQRGNIVVAPRPPR